MTFLLSTGIIFYTIVSVVFSLFLFNSSWDSMADPFVGNVVEKSETLAMVVIIFGMPAMFVGLVLAWPVVLYRQIRKELADAD
ncbi:hypothetical protein [Mycobacteroides chelonae]|uniref:hypothetical protein n=1 Tax=Mycobacteroides chelonae TaxID=1774 RepID=UPI0009947F1B|nr:hypothetical protein [Mycobacteroides chelonae]